MRELGRRNNQSVGATRHLRAVLDPGEAARVLTTLYALGLGVGLVVLVSSLVSRDLRLGLLSASLAFGALLLLFLSRIKRTALAGTLGSGFLLVLATAAMITGHGIRDLSLPIFSFSILIANLVLPGTQALFITGASCLIVSGLALAEYLGLFTTSLSANTSGSAVVVVSMSHLALAITARRLVQAFHEGVAKTQVQERSYRHIFNATSEAILLLEQRSKRIIDGNSSARTMFGLSDAELKSCSLYDLVGPLSSEDKPTGLTSESSTAEPLLFEWTAKHKSGTQYPVEVSLRPARIDSQQVFLVVMRDVADRKRLQAELQESEKLKAVGQLAGGIAHDFNNQLTGILANATMLQEKLQETQLKKYADLIVRCSKRSADLTSQLLAFARRGKYRDVTVDIYELINEVVDLLKHTIDKRIVLEIHDSGEELQVRGDPTLLQNALLNLGLNACDAMPKGGTLAFHIAKADAIKDNLSPRPDPEQKWAEIVVADTGSGMDEATRSQVFEPFFTTKKQGNGMGLAAVYGAVQSHRGHISVESQPHLGTRFTILLPISEQRCESANLSIPMPSVDFAGVRVLLAEDEDDVAATASLILVDLGCKVIRCKDGQEAIETYEQSPQNFDVVILDHMMPRLSGRQALARMRTINPQLRALLTSGYSNQTVIDEVSDVELFLPKPFGPTQLSLALARLFEAQQRQEAEGSLFVGN